LPHSEIRGSTGASPSSRLIAACYVLHRLRTPRHPPDALALTLDRSALVSHAQRKTQGNRTRSLDRDIKINRCANRPIPPSLCQRNLRKSQTRECRRASLHFDFNSLLRRADARLAFRPAFQVLKNVEPIGIEPTTSSLQSSRSPN
jgi:hypothetical protein